MDHGCDPTNSESGTRRSSRVFVGHNCHLKPIRYSLIVSIEAEQDLPIYTTIQNLVPLDA